MVVQPKKDAGGSFAMDVEAREKIVRQARQGSPEGGRLLPRHVARERIRVEETGKKKSKRSGKEETGKLFTDHNSIQSHPQDPTRTNSSTHK